MSMMDQLVPALADFYSVEPSRDGISIVTHCLYPSGKSVRVMVRGAGNSCSVSDECGALHEVIDAGIPWGRAEHAIKSRARRHALNSDRGNVHSDVVEMRTVAAVIAVVANASKDIAAWLFSSTKPEKTDFKESLRKALNDKFNGAVHHNVELRGFSNKSHTFDNVIRINDNSIIVDPVIKDHSSINSRLVANLDVQRLENNKIQQRIIYDDSDEWNSAELSLLSIGAPVVAFTNVDNVISRIVGADIERQHDRH